MKTSAFEIRPAAPSEYDRLAPLVSCVESSPVTGEILRSRHAANPDATSAWLVAEIGETIAGFSRVLRKPHDPAGRFGVLAYVSPAYRGDGLGSALYRKAEALAVGSGATLLRSNVKDNDEASLRFAERFGFAVASHRFESVLDPAAFDAARYEPLLRRIEADGIRFESYAESDGSEAAQRRLYDINLSAGQDVPNSGQFDWPFEQFQRDVFQSHWFRPEGQLLALYGEEAVGLSAVGEMAPGRFYNAFTGVRRDFRGQGLATALKVRTIEVARKMGATEIKAHNDSTNAPMLAINRKLGYLPQPGFLELRREI